MPDLFDDASSNPMIAANVVTRIGEQVARMDGRFTSEIVGLKKDTEAIKQTLNDISREQKSAISADQRCETGLALLTEKLAAISVLVTSLSADVKQFNQDRGRFQGGWWMLGVVFAILTSVTTIGLFILQRVTVAFN